MNTGDCRGHGSHPKDRTWPSAYLLPLTYANDALRSVMIKGWGAAEIWPQLAALVIFSAAMIFLATVTTHREVV